MGDVEGARLRSPSSSSSDPSEEDAHFFDFLPFFRKPEFCDRIIRLEILQEEAIGEDEGQSGSPAARGAIEEDLQAGSVERDNLATESASLARATGLEAETLTGKKRPREQGEDPVSHFQIGLRRARFETEPGGEAAEQLADCGVAANAGNLADATGQKEGEEACHEEMQGSNREGKDDANVGEEDDLGEGLEDGVKTGSANEEGGGVPCNFEEGAVSGIGGGSQKGEGGEDIAICSAIVAAKSRVLNKMMSSEMREAQKDVPLVVKVTREEKGAFKEMLYFIYAGALSEHVLNSETPIAELIAMLLLGDKFEVPSFLGAILAVVTARTSTTSDIEVVALDLPEVLQHRKAVKHLVERAQELLVEKFKRVDKWDCKEFHNLCERAVHFLLQSEDLQGGNEEDLLYKLCHWVNSNFEAGVMRHEAMARLARHVRFGCIRGEYLETMLGHPLMQAPGTQSLLLKGLAFQAYSERKKLASSSMFSQVRAGFNTEVFEFIVNAQIDDSETVTQTKSVEWCGRRWWVKVRKAKSNDPPTVGVYLHRSAMPVGEDNQADIFQLEVHARRWPTGYWAYTSRSCVTFSKVTEEGKGCKSALGIPWDRVEDSVYIGCTGEVTFKAIVRRQVK